MSTGTYLAFDLGAESGRAMLGVLRDRTLTLEEVHRFQNGPTNILGHLHWDVFRLADELKSGLRAVSGRPPDGIGIDTWGVDYALLAEDGSFLGLPYAYRDSRTDGVLPLLLADIPADRLYARTGVQFQPFNTLVQLYAAHRAGMPALAAAADLLFIPDALTYLLTGIRSTEYTFASTSQMLDPSTLSWATDVIHDAGLRPALLQPLCTPGSVVGPLHPSVAASAGFTTDVITVASHDTASAVAAVPAEGEGWAYLSSGTWSLLGVERRTPICSPAARVANFTNEVGVGPSIRFLRNIMGLWLLQECRRVWSRDGEVTYEALVRQAASAVPFRSLVDPDHPRFLRPAGMPEEIAAFCRETDQPVPSSRAEFARCIFDSLALKYRMSLEGLRDVTGTPVTRLHVIGGGSRNALLCQSTADAAGIPVFAGPVEATAIGNILVQALARGLVGSLEEMRAVVRASFPIRRYDPAPGGGWDHAARRFAALTAHASIAP
jgi:rhamnulokinase